MSGYKLEKLLGHSVYLILCRLTWGFGASALGLVGSAYAQGDTVIPGLPPEVDAVLSAYGFPGVLLLLGWWARGIAATYAEKLPDMRDGVPLVVRLSDEDRELLNRLRGDHGSDHDQR